MNVLSLFDGISCARIALERSNIPIQSYYASEIDKYAIQVSQKNYPDIIRLGDINNFNGTTWDKPCDYRWIHPSPDLIMGGSPCQGFSFAGKQLAFDDPRSVLFFKFVEIVNHYKPKYFLLENVRMKKEHQDVISKHLGVQPICINSSLVSAQNRIRYYWTNIPNVTQPEDRHIYLKDIIEYGIVDKDKSYCIDANYWKGGNLTQYFEKHRKQLVFELAKENKRVVAVSINNRGVRPHRGDSKKSGVSEFGRIAYETGKTDCLTVAHAPKIFQTSERGRRLTLEGTKRDDKNGSVVRGYEVRPDGKTCALITVLKDNYVTEDFVIRKLTPLECERLQTLPDNYTNGVSNTQRYRMLGNAWTVDVISHILNFIK